MLAVLTNLAVIGFICIMLGLQAGVWYDFFFRAPHPGPPAVKIANHFSQVLTLLLFSPGVYLLFTNLHSLSWFTLWYFVCGVMELFSTIFAAKASKQRKEVLKQHSDDLRERVVRLNTIRAKRELIARG